MRQELVFNIPLAENAEHAEFIFISPRSLRSLREDSFLTDSINGAVYNY